MKIRRLPDQDIARIAPMNTEQKYNALMQMKIGRPPYSLAPVRKEYFDIFNIVSGPLFTLERTPWKNIELNIARKARSSEERDANLQVAKLLFSYAEANDTFGQRSDFMPLPIGTGDKVSFWTPATISMGGTPTVIFIDPRKTKTLTRDSRRFIFSMMHERIRVLDNDYSDVQLSILQLPANKDGKREVRLYTADHAELYSFYELNDMITETYKIWAEVLAERERDTRYRSTGTTGTLL